jgi:spore coat protein CotH
MVGSHRTLLALGSLLICTLCAHDSPAGRPPTRPDPFAGEAWPSSDQVLAIELRLKPSDWEAIRNEGRTINEMYSGCRDPGFGYTSVDAELKVGTRDLGRVSVRKKGLFGSLSANKPSLRIALAAHQPELRLFGSKTLVLNNSRQDASFTHQCMAYAAFAAAGLPAARCGFARVVVNGRELGYYVVVEAIKKPFLKRAFGDDKGILYEGNAGADFRAERLAAFEAETEGTGETPFLKQVAAALAGPASEAQFEQLDQLLDLPSFMRYWAMEALIAHWDGYSGDLNNFFVFVPRATGKLVFIPWGTDGAYTHEHAFLPELGRPQSVYAVARLPQRLYERAETRELYRSALRALLNEHWNEKALLSEVDRIARLVPEASPAALEAQRTFILNRRSELQAELASEAPPWPYAEPPLTVCRPDLDSPLTAEFDIPWRGLSTVQASSNNALELQVDGERHAYSGILGSAGRAQESDGANPSFRLLAPQPDGTYVVLTMNIGARPLAPGTVRLHGFETYGVVVRAPNAQHYAMKGFVGAGEITFDEVGTDKLRGAIHAKFVSLTPELARLLSKP